MVAMVMVLRSGKVDHLAIALSLVDRRGGITFRHPSFDPNLWKVGSFVRHGFRISRHCIFSSPLFKELKNSRNKKV